MAHMRLSLCRSDWSYDDRLNNVDGLGLGWVSMMPNEIPWVTDHHSELGQGANLISPENLGASCEDTCLETEQANLLAVLEGTSLGLPNCEPYVQSSTEDEQYEQLKKEPDSLHPCESLQYHSNRSLLP